MEEKRKLNNLMEVTMSKIKEMVDVNTIVGQPMQVGEITIVPVSKVAFGFASGGSDFTKKDVEPAFGGGGGAGVNITPVGFLIVKGDSVRMMPVAIPASTTADRILEMVPEVVDKVAEMLPKKDKKSEEASEEE